MGAGAAMRWGPGWFRQLDVEIASLEQWDTADAGAIRRELAKDPVAFAMIYLESHLRSKPDEYGNRGDVSFSEIHFDWARIAETWATPPQRIGENRHGVISPRECGKTTWWYLILPLWAAANGYVRFAVAFAKDESLAHGHLATFKHELENNQLLNADYPELCTPARKQTGQTLADRQGMLHTQGGFIFAAKGIEGSNLGLKVGSQRPDLIILDDIEPDEAKYSATLAEKRLGTLLDALVPLNLYARMLISGTVTMPESITHQIVKAAQGVEVAPWIKDIGLQCHWYNAIQVNDDGTERSAWPEKWPLAELQAMRHTRSYAKNYLNDPMARDGSYWTSDDFRYGELDGVTKVGLFVDPAITARKTSDFTGLAVVGWAPEQGGPGRVVVLHAEGVRLTGQPLRQHILKLLARFERVKRVIVEVNQGGDLWLEVFHDMPSVKVVTHTASEAKEIRFATALDFYQRGRVLHIGKITTLESQAVAFPKAAHDDIIDATAAGVLYFLDPERKPKARVTSASYV